VAVSKQFNALVLDLLGEVTAVSARRMFGGVGYYAAPEELALWTRRAIAVARLAPPGTPGSPPRLAPRRGR